MEYLERHISAQDGLRLYVRDYRPVEVLGLPVLCLSGLTRNSQDFEHIASVLCSRGHRVVTMDYRGRGRSDYDDDWSNYVPQTYVSDIFQITAALGLHKCIFLGTSLGGILSMAMSVVAPSLVHSVILNDVGPDLDENGIGKIIAYTGDASSVADLDAAVEKLKSYYPDELGFVDKDWRDVAKKTYKLENGRYIPNWDTKIADILRLSIANKEKQDLWPYFKALADRKVLVIRGDVSSVFKEQTYKKMMETLPHITGVVLQGVGHAPTLQEEEAEEAILDFISVP